MNKIFYTAAVLFVFLSFFSLNAQSIKRDASFGDNGTIYLRDARFDYTTLKLFQDPSTEEMLNAGFYYDYDNDESGLFFSKNKSNGDLDGTFASNGVLRLSSVDYPFRNIIRIRQAVDKSYLVLLGNSDVHNADTTAVICFTSKGKIVTDFGNGGLLTGSKGVIRDFDILADAKVLALSSSIDTTTLETTNWFGRYTQLGVSDPTFGSAGYQEFEKSFAGYVRMDKVGQTYVCTGNAIDLAQQTFVPVLCKVNANGIQDKSFGEPAAVFGAGLNSGALVFPTNLHPLKDGGFLVDGYSINLDSFYLADFVTKMDKNGQTVSTFGTDGYLEFDDLWQGELYGLSAMELPGNQILVTNTDVDNSDMLEMSFYLFDKDGVAVSKFGNKGNQRMKIDDLQTIVLSAFISPVGKIFVGGDVTNSADVYESHISKLLLNSVSVSEEQDAVGQAVVFPNPVADKAIITYDLPESMPVSIDLTDLQGRKVQSVVNEQVRAEGKQKEEINLNSAVAPGVYMLQIGTAGRQLYTIKIVKM